MNRQANLGRSYQDYISHFRLHLRDLKPLLPSATETRASSFLSAQNVSELEGPVVTPLPKRPSSAILDTDKSCPSFFNTRARFYSGPLLSSGLPFFNGRTGNIGRWRFLIGRTFPAARVLSRASTLNLINRRGSWPSTPALITVRSYAYMAAALGAPCRERRGHRRSRHLLEPLV